MRMKCKNALTFDEPVNNPTIEATIDSTERVKQLEYAINEMANALTDKNLPPSSRMVVALGIYVDTMTKVAVK